MPRDRPPTSADVARHAGVSRATVSYVLNNVANHGLRPETVARVRSSALALGYVPHAMARLLRKRTSNLILIAETTLPPGPLVDTFYGEMRHTLTALGYTVITHADREHSGAEAARAWAAFRPAAVIVRTDRLDPPALEVLHATGTRVVLGLGPVASPLVPTLVIDHTSVGACAVSYLAQRGYRRVGVVVPREAELIELGLQRLAGCSSLPGIRVDRLDLTLSVDEAARLAASWRDGDHPSAAFTYNDEYGMLLQRALLDAGLRIPEDVALVGADDLPLCELLRPRLTSVHIDARWAGHSVAESLHGLLEGGIRELEPLSLLHARIVARESA